MRTIAFRLSLLFIFMIPWEGALHVEGGSQTFAKFMGLGVAGVWALSVLATRRIRRPSLIHLALGAFVVWNALSVSWSADAGRTLRQLLTWVQLFGFVLLLWDLYTTRTALLVGLQAFVLGAYVAVGLAFGNLFSDKTAYYARYERFSPGEQVNPDGFGFIVALGIPVACYLASSIGAAGWRPVWRLVNYAYIPVAFLGISLSGTRAAALAAIPGIVFGVSTLTRVRLRRRVGIALAMAAAILVALPYVQTLKSFQRFGTIGTEITEGSLTGRTDLWRAGLESLEEKPLLGVGANMYRSVNDLGKVAHNSFLSVAVELGVIGGLLFVGILGMAAVQAWSQPTRDARFWLTMLLVWSIGASSLTWEYRKPTWLFIGLCAVSAALGAQRGGGLQFAPRGGSLRGHSLAGP